MKNTFKRIYSFLMICLVLAMPCFVGLQSADAVILSKKVDLVFIIDSTGSMEDEIDSVKRNIKDFMDYFDEARIELRIGFIEYRDITVDGESSTKIYKNSAGSEWHTDAEEALSTLSKINVSGGGDDPETPLDALGNLIKSSGMSKEGESPPIDWDMDATRFAVLITDADYKIDNSHGLESMDQFIDAATILFERKINVSVITKTDYYDVYKELTEKTGGILADIDSYDYSDLLKDFAETIIDLVDTDGDGLPDKWEIEGADFDGDGVIDLPLNEYGADPEVRDIFVEVDWMVRPESGPWYHKTPEHSFAPSESAMRMVFDAFKEQNINLHIDAGPDSVDFVTGKKWGSMSGGNEVTYIQNLDLTTNYDSWTKLVDANFAENRRKVFRHSIFADCFNSSTISGIAANIPGQVFLVTLGAWGDVTDIQVAGTFMHELGHTLGLKHGGGDHEIGKPNYLSVMNYTYQTTGLLGTNLPDYSSVELPALTSSELDENVGLDPDCLTEELGLGARWFTFTDSGIMTHTAERIAGSSIDFDGDGKSDEKNLSLTFCDDDGTKLPETINSYDDWSNLVFFGGLIGASGDDLSIKIMKLDINALREITYDEAKDLGILGNPGAGSVSLADSVTVIAEKPNQNIFVNINNLGADETTFDVTIESELVSGVFTQTVTVGGTRSDDSAVMLTVPLVDSPKEGEYTLKCNVSSELIKNQLSELSVSVYNPTEEEINQLKVLIDDGSSGLPEYLLEQYAAALSTQAALMSIIWIVLILIIIVIIIIAILVIALLGRKKTTDDYDIPIISDDGYCHKSGGKLVINRNEEAYAEDNGYVTDSLENNGSLGSTEPLTKAYISILTGSMAGMKIPIGNDTIHLGKDPATNNVVFSSDYKKVSRSHCTICFSENQNKFVVVDHSLNGTYYKNHIRLEKGHRTQIEPGTTILLADEDCEIYLGK